MESTAHIPRQKYRACILCSSLKTVSEFKKEGCDNCESILQLQGNSERISDCTSPSYSGMIAMTDPNLSWVAKFQRIKQYSKGLYAIKVYGHLPDYILHELDRKGISYR